MELLKKKIDEVLDDVHKSYVREILKHTYKCSYECVSKNRDRVASSTCVSQCNTQLEKVQASIHDNSSEFRDSLETCVNECYLSAMQEVNSPQPDEQIDVLREKLKNCQDACVDTHIQYLPKLRERIENDVSRASRSH